MYTQNFCGSPLLVFFAELKQNRSDMAPIIRNIALEFCIKTNCYGVAPVTQNHGIFAARQNCSDVAQQIRCYESLVSRHVFSCLALRDHSFRMSNPVLIYPFQQWIWNETVLSSPEGRKGMSTARDDQLEEPWEVEKGESVRAHFSIQFNSNHV